jgi:uncharacterized protein
MLPSFKKIILIAIIVLIVAGAAGVAYPYFLSLRGENAEKKIVIHQAIDENKPFIIESKGVQIKADIADTEAERRQGLSGAQYLNDNEGKFFIFEKAGYHSFWMKDMLFPIDIIFLDESMVVVDIKKNISPDTYPEVFSPQAKAKYVLEINGGLSDKYGFAIGDKWVIPEGGIQI